jgi:copper chaperone CopZ
VLLVALAFPVAGARGELVEVRQVAGGMECAECARNLKLDIGRLDGVEAAAASWNRRVLTVRFRASSRATLEEVREVVRRHHFSAREAEVVARGRLSDAPGGTALLLTVTGSGAVYEIAAGIRPAGAAPTGGLDLMARLAREAGRGGELTVRGRVAGDEVPGSPGATGARSGAARLWIQEILEIQEVSEILAR